MRHKLSLVVAVAGVALVAAACGAGHRALPVISVTEKDFRITAPHVVPAGDVRIVVHNRGPVSHELVIARALHRRLPLRSDGFTIDEDAIEHRIVETIEPQHPGTQGSVVVHLAPGRYLLFCNMAGHYAGGMLTSFRVR